MEKFLEIVLAGMEIPVFLAYFVLALFGAVGAVLYNANKKLEEVQGTPDKFSLNFFVRNNIMKWLLQVFTIVPGILFCNALTGQEITGFAALFIGVGSGSLSIWGHRLEDKPRQEFKKDQEN